MSVVELLDGLLRPARCLGCGAPAAWPCCPRCLPSEPGQVGPWHLAPDPQVPLWAAPGRAGVGADRVPWVAGRSAGLPRDHAERIGAGVAATLGLPALGLLAPARRRHPGPARPA